MKCSFICVCACVSVCLWEMMLINLISLGGAGNQDEDEDDLEEEEKVVEKNKKEKIIRKPAKERKIKIVEDFNLLEVPGKTNLQPLFDEFVIPMLPDGYEIKFEQKKSNGYDKNIFKDNKIYTIQDIVFQTRSARALFPNTSTRTILKVVKVSLFLKKMK